MTKYYFPCIAVQKRFLKFEYRLRTASKFLNRWQEKNVDFIVSCQLWPALTCSRTARCTNCTFGLKSIGGRSGEQGDVPIPWGTWPVSGSASIQKAGLCYSPDGALAVPPPPHSQMNSHWKRPLAWILPGSYWMKKEQITAITDNNLQKVWDSVTTRQYIARQRDGI